MNIALRETQSMQILSRFLIRAHCNNNEQTTLTDLLQLQRDLQCVAAFSASQLEAFLSLAANHHVIVRALTAIHNAATLQNEERIAAWCDSSVAAERSRIERAVRYLKSICSTLESRGCKVAVIKSLDHWPDFGSDLDLCTAADNHDVEQVMRQEFDARSVQRSWGDRLANKWNYSLPGLPELVEIHVQYLGQTGEQAQLAQRVISRKVPRFIDDHAFQVPAVEERIMISALQRVYRHLYFRLCDMVDIALLLQTGTVDFDELRRASNCAGIWPGVASFLCLVRNYVKSYGGVVDLPDNVIASAYSAQSSVQFKGGYLRVPKAMAIGLYLSQLVQAGWRRDLRALLRLPLLPPLAVSALVAYRLSGDDKGVW